MEAKVSDPGVRQKPPVRMLLRFSLGLAVVGLVVGAVANLGLYLNGDFLPEEVRGPHPLAGASGEISLRVGIFVIPCAVVLNFFGLPLSFFRAPVAANFLAAFSGLLVGAIACQITFNGGLERVRANPARRHAVAVTKLGTMVDRYAKEHDGHLPASDHWCETLTEFDPSAAGCLSYLMKKDTPPGFSTVALNARLEGKRLADVPGDVVLLFGTRPARNPVGDSQLLTADEYEAKGTVVLFVDLHVEFVNASRFARLRWGP
jgi:hypothetical protein